MWLLSSKTLSPILCETIFNIDEPSLLSGGPASLVMGQHHQEFDNNNPSMPTDNQQHQQWVKFQSLFSRMCRLRNFSCETQFLKFRCKQAKFFGGLEATVKLKNSNWIRKGPTIQPEAKICCDPRISMKHRYNGSTFRACYLHFRSQFQR